MNFFDFMNECKFDSYPQGGNRYVATALWIRYSRTPEIGSAWVGTYSIRIDLFSLLEKC